VAPVTITSIPATAAVRRRTLSTPVSPFALLTGNASWRVQVPCLGVLAGMRGGALGSLHPTHNSIPATVRSTVSTTDVTPVNADGDAYGAAKQAAPPRGVPR
jgi:hypothetical protein